MTLPDTELQRLLRRLAACDAAREWAGRRTLEQAWRECPRPDWLLWLHARLTPAPWAYVGLAEAWAGDADAAVTRARAHAAEATAATAYAADAYAAAEATAAAAADAAIYVAADAAIYVAADAAIYGAATAATAAIYGAATYATTQARQADEARAVLFCPEVAP